MRALSKYLLLLFAVILPLGHCFAEEEDSPLAKEMAAMNRSFRKVKRQYTDPAQKDAVLELISAMQKNVEAAKIMTPSQLAKVPEADKAKYLELFQKQLAALATELTALKDAVAAGKIDSAKAEIDKIWELKTQSHKELHVNQDEG